MLTGRPAPRRLRPLLKLLLLLVPLRAAWAQDDADGIRRPERLTVGVSDQFLGQVSPDGKTLYFLSDKNTIREVYQQDVEAARATVLFDEGADVSWARVSPDGRRLLYISYREDAAGRLCVRDLVAGKERPRCLDDIAPRGEAPSPSPSIEAQWMSPTRIALVSRPALQGDLQLMQVDVGDRLRARPLLQRNLTNPTVSPDGRWVVYVPVQRYVEQVGPGFAARAALRLEAARLDRDGAPQPLAINLPGRTGQPVFSADGRYLYFVQFLHDTNQDGTVDAADNGVLFRVPFPGQADDAPAQAARAFPEQLTDSSWNCHYPSPAATQLISTCARDANLDIYTLPLDGLVPSTWDAERLHLEIDLSTRALDQQLLYRHLLQRPISQLLRRRALLRLIHLHQEGGEFDAADFYTRSLDGITDDATAGLAEVMRVQIAHRRAMRARAAGRLGVSFPEQSRARLEALDPQKGADMSPAARVLRRVARSEIAASLGDIDGALRELGAAEAELPAVTVPEVLEEYHDRADAQHRQLDDAAALWQAMRRLAEHPALEPDDQLDYARGAARALVRGLPQEAAQELLKGRLAEAAPGSELAFALELTQAVLRIRPDRTDGLEGDKRTQARQADRAVRDALIAMYKRQTRFDRKRAVMMEAVQRATDLDAERVIEALVQIYIDDVPRGTRERRRAERLYQRFMEGRAYRRLSRGRLDGARDDFRLVARTTGSLESHIGYIDLLLRAGKTPEQIQAEYDRDAALATGGAARFVRAYLTALRLPGVGDKEHPVVSRQITTQLRGGGAAFRAQAPVRALYGVVLHERYLRTGGLALAQRADGHYLVALELVKRNPRYKALILGQLGALHAQVGNYRIALGFLQDREKLPFADDLGALGHQLVKGRVLLHLDRGEDAAKAAEAGLALAQRAPALKEYRVLALDRAALYNLSAGRFKRALELYDGEIPLLQSAPGPLWARNRVVARLARAAAAQGDGQPRRALEDLAEVDAVLGDPDRKTPGLRDALRWPHSPIDETLRSYRLIAAGLRAQAHRGVGDLAGAARALDTRRALLQGRLDRSHLDEDLRALTLVEAQLADVANERHKTEETARWARAALGHADAFVRSTKIPLNSDQLDLLWFVSELRLGSGARLRSNLSTRLRDAHAQMIKERDPTWRSYQSLFELYLPLLGRGRGAGAGAGRKP